jgi:hypothetical protein
LPKSRLARFPAILRRRVDRGSGARGRPGPRGNVPGRAASGARARQGAGTREMLPTAFLLDTPNVSSADARGLFGPFVAQ